MDSMDSETQIPDDFTDLESGYDSPPALAQECNTFKWRVQVIDDDSTIESKMVTSRDVWKLQNCKVIVHFDEDSGQPVGDSAGLLGSWLGQLSNDVHLLPINYSDWRTVATHIKDKAWDVIQSRFWFADPMRRKKYVMGALGSRCKDVKLRLWKEHKRNDRAATLQNRPKDVPEDQWSHLVQIRFTDKWKRMKDRNTQNQSKHKTPHVCGRKSFGRRRHEIKIKTGKTPSRAEMFIATRTKHDGSFASEEAKTHAEALQTLLSQNASTQVTSNAPARLDDEYAQVFGPERSGRVRCVGRGPTPSRLPRSSPTVTPDIENSETVVQLKAEVKTLGDKVKTMDTFIQQLLNSSGEEENAWSAKLAAILATIRSSSNSQGIVDGGNERQEHV